MAPTLAAWAALIGGIVALLLLDLFVLHRGAHEVPIANAAWSTAFFVAVALGFGAVLGVIEGGEIAEQYLAGYILEWSLSLDNVFVWALIFSAFTIPSAYQHRVLFYGIFGALVMRGAFVAAGSGLLANFEWIIYVFGALLIFSGLRMLRGKHDYDPAKSVAVRLLRGCCVAASRRRGTSARPTSSCRPTPWRPRTGLRGARCSAAGTRRRCSRCSRSSRPPT
jgi:tellurite resistance protein TerC